jgi:hypothetical protein
VKSPWFHDAGQVEHGMRIIRNVVARVDDGHLKMDTLDRYPPARLSAFCNGHISGQTNDLFRFLKQSC